MPGEPGEGTGETRAGLASTVIHLPDLSPRPAARKKPKRQRAHVERFRTNDEEHAELDRRARDAGLSVNAYSRLRTLGDPGPRARRRAPVDATALAQGLVAFNRQHSNYNQAVRALNTLVLFAEEHGSERVAREVQELRRVIEQLQEQFDAPVAAILEAMRYDRQG
jgi:DNA-binding transcriptional MerR regulator